MATGTANPMYQPSPSIYDAWAATLYPLLMPALLASAGPVVVVLTARNRAPVLLLSIAVLTMFADGLLGSCAFPLQHQYAFSPAVNTLLAYAGTGAYWLSGAVLGPLLEHLGCHRSCRALAVAGVVGSVTMMLPMNLAWIISRVTVATAMSGLTGWAEFALYRAVPLTDASSAAAASAGGASRAHRTSAAAASSAALAKRSDSPPEHQQPQQSQQQGWRFSAGGSSAAPSQLGSVQARGNNAAAAVTSFAPTGDAEASDLGERTTSTGAFSSDAGVISEEQAMVRGSGSALTLLHLARPAMLWAAMRLAPHLNAETPRVSIGPCWIAGLCFASVFVLVSIASAASLGDAPASAAAALSTTVLERQYRQRYAAAMTTLGAVRHVAHHVVDIFFGAAFTVMSLLWVPMLELYDETVPFGFVFELFMLATFLGGVATFPSWFVGAAEALVIVLLSLCERTLLGSRKYAIPVTIMLGGMAMHATNGAVSLAASLWRATQFGRSGTATLTHLFLVRACTGVVTRHMLRSIDGACMEDALVWEASWMRWLMWVEAIALTQCIVGRFDSRREARRPLPSAPPPPPMMCSPHPGSPDRSEKESVLLMSVHADGAAAFSTTQSDESPSISVQKRPGR